MAPKPEAAEATPESTATPAAAPISTDTLMLAKVMAQEIVAAQEVAREREREFQRELVDRQNAAHRETVEAANRERDNPNPPMLSDFNPRGDRDFPRPDLRYPFTMNGADMPEHLMLYEEKELLNLLEPGHYRITKTDDTQVVVSVVPTHDSATGAITKMTLVSQFGNKSNPEDAKNWPPQRVWLAEMLGVPVPQRDVPRQPTGRILAPMLGSQSSTNGVISGSLESNMHNLGPMRGAVEAMLAHAGDAMEPARG